MTHHMKLRPGSLELMRSGRKTIELRLRDAKRQGVAVGDTIVFSNAENPREKLKVRVTALHPFSSFAELYASLNLLQCGYTEETLSAASPADMEQFYTKEEQKQWGVVGIEIMPIMDKRQAQLVKISRYISFILRHKPEAIGITLDSHGWANTAELIRGVSKTYPLDMATLEEIVANDEKRRYSFNEDKTLIRANQGHTVKVDVELEEVEPPEYLWHGTATKYASSIERSGLIAKKRLYVHLSEDKETAIKVGARHGEPVLYRVNAGEMRRDGGFRFLRSANNVYLISYVPANYLYREDI